MSDLQQQDLERAGYLFNIELGEQNISVEVMDLEGWRWLYAIPVRDGAIAALMELAVKKANQHYEQVLELIALRDFANYILRETDATIKEHGYKPLEQIDPDNTKMDIHVFVSELQKAKRIVRQTKESA